MERWQLAAAGLFLIAGGGYLHMSNRKSGPRWERVLPELKQKTLQLELLARERGLDVMFWDGWRDPAETVKNIAAGTSKVKDAFGSLHTWGAAVDIVFRNSVGMASWPADTDPRWRQLAQLGESIGLFSGGINWGWDWPHFQLRNLSTTGLKKTYGNNYAAFLNSRGVMVA